MCLAELVLEFFPVDDVCFNLHGFDVFPPSTRRSRKEVGGEQHLLIIADSGDLQVVLNGAKPIIGIKGSSALGENRWVGALEIFQLGAWVSISVLAIIVVGVSGSKLSEVLKGSKISLTLRTDGLTVFHHKAQKLSHGRVRRCRGVLV